MGFNDNEALVSKQCRQDIDITTLNIKRDTLNRKDNCIDFILINPSLTPRWTHLDHSEKEKL